MPKSQGQSSTDIGTSSTEIVVRRTTRTRHQNGVNRVEKQTTATSNGRAENNAGIGNGLPNAVGDVETITHSNKRRRTSATSECTFSKCTPPVSPSNSSSASTIVGSVSESEDNSPEVEDHFEVERIIDYVKNTPAVYHIKWKSWGSEHNTWEPLSNLTGCDDELYRFYKQRKTDSKNPAKKPRPGYSGHVPPDPRPFEVRVNQFFKENKLVQESYTPKALENLKSKNQSLPKSQWPSSKVDTFLEKGIDKELSQSDIRSLINELRIIGVRNKMTEITSQLKEWEARIKLMTKGIPCITVENIVDDTKPPKEFTFIEKYMPGKGVIIPSDPPVGCECHNCYDNRDKKVKTCCPMSAGHTFAYTKFKKLNVQNGSAIYECNSKCICGPECSNRVVQSGKTELKFCIFRTNNGRGWGVKTPKSIKKGTYVTLYLGEVIESDEAEIREKQYDESGQTYLFDLDFNDPETCPFTVDASKVGNVSHFINHSCSPNLAVFAVWVDCLDPNLPMLAMFTTKDIAKDEELTFDYQQTPRGRKKKEEESKEKRTVCLCGTKKCRGYIF